ncbi:MAG: hypothetical protein PHT99_06180 [Methanoregula sp.]|nr:hypothetical protein [Methanoregula sp.]
MITGILMGLFVVITLLINANFMVGPANAITYSAFTDIGNGVSTRIVDVYALAPENGNISSDFNIPDEVAGRGYFVDVGNSGDASTQRVTISRDTVSTNIALAGIGSSLRAGGNTTGMGMNRISYESGGF